MKEVCVGHTHHSSTVHRVTPTQPTKSPPWCQNSSSGLLPPPPLNQPGQTTGPGAVQHPVPTPSVSSTLGSFTPSHTRMCPCDKTHRKQTRSRCTHLKIWQEVSANLQSAHQRVQTNERRTQTANRPGNSPVDWDFLNTVSPQSPVAPVWTAWTHIRVLYYLNVLSQVDLFPKQEWGDWFTG